MGPCHTSRTTRQYLSAIVWFLPASAIGHPKCTCGRFNHVPSHLPSPGYSQTLKPVSVNFASTVATICLRAAQSFASKWGLPSMHSNSTSTGGSTSARPSINIPKAPSLSRVASTWTTSAGKNAGCSSRSANTLVGYDWQNQCQSSLA